MARPATTSPVGFLKPEIPTLVPELPSGEGWIHEIKHNGYRTLIVIDGENVRAFSRWGRDWTGPYRRVVDSAAKLSCKAALIDGEMVVQDEHGITDFHARRSAIYTEPHLLEFSIERRTDAAGASLGGPLQPLLPLNPRRLRHRQFRQLVRLPVLAVA